MHTPPRRPGLLQSFGSSAILTVLVLGAILWFLGVAATTITLVLIAIEVAFSLDNAILNAKILATLSVFWQRIFLSLGVVVAVLGMRIIFPIAIVAITAHSSWRHVLNLALYHPTQYAARVESAHAAIAAFGGSFLLTLALDFFLDDERRVLWLVQLERFLQRVSRVWLPYAVTILSVCIVTCLSIHHGPRRIFVSGMAGVAAYVAVQLVTKVFGMTQRGTTYIKTGFAAFTTFLYLEILDASFSFDGVLGAFAVTSRVILIASGLGVGALWVRSLSVFMVRSGTLKKYRYVEHGAHYTILILACLLFLSVVANVPDVIAGLAGLGCLGASFIASRQAAANAR